MTEDERMFQEMCPGDCDGCTYAIRQSLSTLRYFWEEPKILGCRLEDMAKGGTVSNG